MCTISSMKGKFGKYTEERSIDKYLTKYIIYIQKIKCACATLETEILKQNNLYLFLRMSYDLRFSKYCWFRKIITTSSVATQYPKKVFLDIYTEDIVIWYTLN